MCGIAGFIPSDPNPSEDIKLINKMTQALEHRGPDAKGEWVNANNTVYFGHRRLSILDLSSAGHQPMLSQTGRYVISYNGEIYNHIQLRQEMKLLEAGKNIKWNGSSDTETLLACFEIWGIEKSLNKLKGMFAIALWDSKEEILHLIRDRFGEKPLYYGWSSNSQKNHFAFASELKSIKENSNFKNNISRYAIGLFIKYSYVPAPLSIYENIFKLEAGSRLSIKKDYKLIKNGDSTPANCDNFKIEKWWNLKKIVERSVSNKINDKEEAIRKTEKALNSSVLNQSISDVPLGSFLSGGVDSSLISALMQKNSMKKIKTFTVGFENKDYDESSHARSVASYIGSDHTEMFVSEREAQQVIPNLCNIYDEPFADSSQVPTYLLCKAAKKEVTVALSGDAGDEIFGGYNRYIWTQKIWNNLSVIPYPLRNFLSKSALKISELSLSKLDAIIHVKRSGQKIHKLAKSIENINSNHDLFKNIISEFKKPSLIVKEFNDGFFEESFKGFSEENLPSVLKGDSQHSMMFFDTKNYLSDDILCKVDRAAMSNSLETRVPFLDNDLVELAWQLPVDMKIQGGTGKKILREILYKYVPRDLIERPKVGFSIPLDDWLRGPLREWAESLLNVDRIEQEGYFYSEPIEIMWREHIEKKYNHSSGLWNILIFQSWLEEHK
tara:strand:- start:121 stop:2121 length:2001 start_codon:yes stop_codon:yes gene_type:complete